MFAIKYTDRLLNMVGWFLTAFVLEKNFRTTHAMLVLHVWMCLVRLRSEDKDGADFGQALYEIYNEDLERRVVTAGVCNHNLKLFSPFLRCF